ncbi:hypothetical protein R3P38DRAFT_1514962 [Favolaschia claudopus]|uniref:DUF6534 domain-containing protein n=1 Tax=Favolaschia claudopus TaxID=2862362 RepID=A0AAW0AJW9_9AGAR
MTRRPLSASPLTPPAMSCPEFEVDNTFGALLIGALFSYTLLGISTIQVYIYFKRFPQDSGKIKLMVAGVWLGEIGQSISFAHALYTLLITNFGHPERLVRFPTSLIVSAFLASLVSFTVQVFFAFRIYTLSKSLWIPGICWTFSLFRLIPPNIILFGWGLRDPAPEILARWGPLFNAIWAVSAVNDLLIAGTMVTLLRQRRAEVLRRTSLVLDKLIAWTIETGVVTSICSIVMLVVFLTLRMTFVWLAIFIVIPRLFANSLLVSLNSRTYLRSAFQPSFPSSGLSSLRPRRQPEPLNIAVEMNKITSMSTDDPHED